ncbi:hypothetical protein [Flavobacterium sp. UBA7682]|uniref:hypothetical protein n=1 Tax=Flavobacterium sp. UBA7682 TaxID=1946560 RepID=UPI0025BB3E33|nr:hypothetical protein [Flavobacterium sp. UBA7682]
MENKATTLENLFENVEQYGKTSLELYKHKAIYEIASLTSTLSVRFILTMVVALVSLFFSIGIALWLGDVLDKNYYGFFIVGLGYLLLWVIILVFRKTWIRTPISNMVIKSMLQTNNRLP